ncbi:TolC family protein [uncultured Desulfuromonas sp.]|uniref:TolC family protein n=1 Tax=uncultured Desulfuromonas sp. TaxID=181013 RepID=UPI002AABC362|nr:TolC family protein [uncultured Desulfuromonas sp.]
MKNQTVPPKRIVSYLAALLCLYCVSSTSWAIEQDILGVPEAITQDIRQRNPLISSAFYDWQALQHRVAPARSLDDPQLSFALSNYPVDSLRGNESAMTGNEIRLFQPIPYPGKRDQRGNVAQENANSAEARYLDQRARSVAQGRKAYYALWYIERSRQRIKDELVELDYLMTLAESRYRSGLESQAGVVDAQLIVSQLREQLIQLEQQQREHLALLNQLRSRPPEYGVSVPETLPLTPLEDNSDWWQHIGQQARSSSPRARQYQAQIRRAEHLKTLADLDRYPDFTVGFSYRQRQATAMDDGTDFVGAELRFNLPVFQDKQREQIAAAQSQQRGAADRWQEYQQRVDQKIFALRTRLHSTQQREALYRSGILAQAQLHYRSRLSAYENDLESFTNVLKSLESWRQRLQDYDAVRRDHQVALATLVELAGDDMVSSLPLTEKEM